MTRVERDDVVEVPGLEVRVEDGAPGGPLVRVSGELDLQSAPALRSVILDAVAPDGSLDAGGGAGRRVVLDLRGLRYADSVGLSTLVACHHRALAAGGELVIRDACDPVRRVLDLSGLFGVLSVEDGATPWPDAGARGDAGAADRDRPRHLLVWLTGLAEDADPHVCLDDELRPGFSLPDWLAGVHDGYPEAVTSVVLDGDAATGEAVAQLVRGRATSRFRGDTTPTSLGELRRWVGGAAEDLRLGEDDDELRARLVLVASELAANVERHAPGWVLVDLAPFRDGALVAVTDSRPVVVPRQDAAAVGAGWRGGLDVVRAVSDAAGLLTGPSTKTVWAVLVSSRTGAAPSAEVTG